jgi:hypothetical protein
MGKCYALPRMRPLKFVIQVVLLCMENCFRFRNLWEHRVKVCALSICDAFSHSTSSDELSSTFLSSSEVNTILLVFFKRCETLWTTSQVNFGGKLGLEMQTRNCTRKVEVRIWQKCRLNAAAATSLFDPCRSDRGRPATKRNALRHGGRQRLEAHSRSRARLDRRS